ncbi:MAG: nitrilase-related carbon-nitrogen hydrolase, partial [Bryobacteraceae bacterium]
MMICWDVQYVQPARALALGGAELIAMPIWGGNEALGQARAIENHVFLATSGYDYPAYIMDPTGGVLAEARETGAAIATIDLSRPPSYHRLGDAKGNVHETRHSKLLPLMAIDPASRTGGLSRRAFLGSLAPTLCAKPRSARIAITLDLEMLRNFPTWDRTEWDFEKGNLDSNTKDYALRLARRVKDRGGRIHFFVVGRVFEQPDVGWLEEILRMGHLLGNHTYDHVD